MQTLILNHYPPVIKQIEEIKQIALAEDIEFSKLNVSIDRVIRNMFILTADKTGIQKFEHLFGIIPKASQSLEERRAIILFQANRRKMSLSELHAMLSGYLPGVQFVIDKKKMKLVVTIGVDAGNVEILRNTIDEILPLNVYFLLGYYDSCKVDVKSKAAIIFTTVFYPRYNLPKLLLDGTWILDGNHTLSGYDSEVQIDFYPVYVKFETKAVAKLKEHTQLHFLMYAEEMVKSLEMVAIKTSAECGIASEQRMGLCMETAGTPEEETKVSFFLGSAKEQIESRQKITVQVSAECQEGTTESMAMQVAAEVSAGVGDVIVENRNMLDGTWLLDGSRKLNGGIYQL